jgi:hypothetical protein
MIQASRQTQSTVESNSRAEAASTRLDEEFAKLFSGNTTKMRGGQAQGRLFRGQALPRNRATLFQ